MDDIIQAVLTLLLYLSTLGFVACLLLLVDKAVAKKEV